MAQAFARLSVASAEDEEEQNMANDRYRDYDTDRDYYGRSETQDYGRDYGARTGSYSSAREYAAAGRLGRDDDRGNSGGYGSGNYGAGGGQGSRGYGYGSGSHERDDDYRRGRDFAGGGNFGRDYDQSRERYGQSYGNRDYYGGQRPGGRDDRSYGQNYGYDSSQRQGSYGSGGRRFEEGYTSGGESSNYRRDSYGFGPQQRPGDRWTQHDRGQNRDYGREPQGYDYDDRGFLARAGDEVRSWFGDDDAERRRELDQRYDERTARQQGSHHSDEHYGSWRRSQIAALDRDYDEYRQENATRFENEFSTWRTDRQGQRDSLSRVAEHMDVVGSDGSHVGTVDKVRGDRIILTKNDAGAGGRHHSIPSRWIQTVEGQKVTLRKTADEAKSHWRDEERNSAFFNENGDEHQSGGRQYGSVSSVTTGGSSVGSSGASSGSTAGSSATSGSASSATGQGEGTHNLNKSFSGTY